MPVSKIDPLMSTVHRVQNLLELRGMHGALLGRRHHFASEGADSNALPFARRPEQLDVRSTPLVVLEGHTELVRQSQYRGMVVVVGELEVHVTTPVWKRMDAGVLNQRSQAGLTDIVNLCPQSSDRAKPAHEIKIVSIAFSFYN